MSPARSTSSMSHSSAGSSTPISSAAEYLQALASVCGIQLFQLRPKVKPSAPLFGQSHDSESLLAPFLALPTPPVIAIMESRALDTFGGSPHASKLEVMPPFVCSAARLTSYTLGDAAVGAAPAPRPETPPPWMSKIKLNNYARVTESQLLTDENSVRESIRVLAYCDTILMGMKKMIESENTANMDFYLFSLKMLDVAVTEAQFRNVVHLHRITTRRRDMAITKPLDDGHLRRLRTASFLKAEALFDPKLLLEISEVRTTSTRDKALEKLVTPRQHQSSPQQRHSTPQARHSTPQRQNSKTPQPVAKNRQQQPQEQQAAQPKQQQQFAPPQQHRQAFSPLPIKRKFSHAKSGGHKKAAPAKQAKKQQ